MKQRSILGLSLTCLIFAAGLSVTARASELDRKTLVTINGPVEIPGRVLEAGTYVFKLADDQRDVVWVFNKDENKLIATIFATPVWVSKTPETTKITLTERVKGAPEAIDDWFYAGDNTGLHFLYPRAAMTGQMLAGTGHSAKAMPHHRKGR